MLRQVKPRNARSKRALEKREPKAIENPKTCLFLRGNNCSQVVQDAMNDLFSMRQPLSKKFTKKNPIHPFEDAASIEFFSEKNDASLFVFGSTQKKRPNSLTFIRTFSHKVLDMLELYLDQESYRSISQFKTKKFAIGMRPMILFAGSAFESPVPNEYTLAKSILIDFFKGEPSDKIDVEGLHTKRSGQKLPRVEVEEIGPRMDLRVGRMQEADEAMLKEAMKKPRGTEERTKKNVTMDSMGDKLGRVHLGKQDLGQLQTRKMKGLKRSRDDAIEPEDIIAEEVPKKAKK
ncbi:hypothetical protein TrVFT333_000857 [Trichoderma virens FT-333]|nr:hypothetical protein TrVFT333_000857 [Trichoderma virens FT-333]